MLVQWHDAMQDTLFNSLALTFLVDLDNKMLARHVKRQRTPNELYRLTCIVVAALSSAVMAATDCVVW